MVLIEGGRVLPTRLSLAIAFWLLSCTTLAAAEPVIPDPINVDRLMDALYGRPHVEGARHWHIPNDLAIEQGEHWRGSDAEVSPVIAHSYRERSVDKFLLLTSTLDPVGGNCHVCPVLIGAFVYARDGSSWCPEAATRALTLAGASGEPPKADLRQLGPTEFGFELRGFYAGTGETTDTLSVYRVTGRQFVRVLQSVTRDAYRAIALSRRYRSDEECQEYRYAIRPLTSATNGLFDLDVLIRSGIRPRGPADRVDDICDVPIERSPNYKQLVTRLIFTGGTYCQEKALLPTGDDLPAVQLAAPLCKPR